MGRCAWGVLMLVLVSGGASGADAPTTTISSTRAAETQEGFESLAEQAAARAKVGEYEQSTELGEAALRLKPGAHEQRLKLAQEYFKLARRPAEAFFMASAVERPKIHTPQNMAESRERWAKGAGHLDILLGANCLDIDTATGLVRDMANGALALHAEKPEDLAPEEAAKQVLLRKAAPILQELPDSLHRFPAPPMQRGTAADIVLEHVMRHADQRPVRKEDLARMGDFLCEVLPKNTPVASGMLRRLAEGSSVLKGLGAKDAAEAWDKFLDRLLASPRAVVHTYGRYGKFCDRRYRQHEASEALLEESRALTKDVESDPVKGLDPLKSFQWDMAQQEARLLTDLRAAANAPETRPAPVRRVVVGGSRPVGKVGEGPVVQPDGSLLCEHVLLTPLDVQVAGADGSQMRKLQAARWRTEGGWASWTGLLPAWKGTDVIYAPGAVLLAGADRVAKEVLVDEKLAIHSAVFDGRYVWVAGGHDRGLYVLNETGQTVAHVTGAQGLPDSARVTPMLAIAPGRIMAAGQVGDDGRGWIATVELDKDKPVVKVIHEAPNVWDPQDRSMNQVLDPAMRFRASWIVAHTDENGKWWAYVGREQAPLVADLQTLKPSVYPLRKIGDLESFPRLEGHADAFVSHEGLLYVAGACSDFHVFRLDAKTQRFTVALPREALEWHIGGSTEGCLAVHEGRLYYAGSRRWLRYDFKSGRDEVLIDNPRSLPEYGVSVGWTLCESQALGFVAHCKGKIYQVQVVGDGRSGH